MCNFSTSRGNQEKSIDIKDRKKKKKTQERQEKKKAKMIERNQNQSVVSGINFSIRKNC